MDKRRSTVKAVHCEMLDQHTNAVNKISVPQHSQPHRDSDSGNTYGPFHESGDQLFNIRNWALTLI